MITYGEFEILGRAVGRIAYGDFQTITPVPDRTGPQYQGRGGVGAIERHIRGESIVPRYANYVALFPAFREERRNAVCQVTINKKVAELFIELREARNFDRCILGPAFSQADEGAIGHTDSLNWFDIIGNILNKYSRR